MTQRRTAALLWLGALLVSAVTLRRTLDPFDEGLLLQAAARITDGQWPYADFGWAYGPGGPLVNASVFALFDPTVLAWRIGRATTDATIAVLVWWLAREQGASGRWALAGGVVAALTMAQPTTANPFATAFALGLAAVACAARRRPIPAGSLAGIACFWRPDFGLAAALAVMAALAAAGAGRAAVVRAALVAGGTAAALYLPFALAAGPGTLASALGTDALRDGDAWRLPFPLLYDGPLRGAEDAKDALAFELPVIALAGLGLAAAVASRARPPAPATAGLLVLALGGLAYLLGRADDLHQQPLLVAVAALLAGLGPRAPRAAAALLAVLGLAGALNLAVSVLRPPDGRALHLPGVPGILVDPAEAAALEALVADVQRRVPPGEPIYVAPRRSDLVTLTNPLLHTLVRRPNVLDRDAQVLNDPAVQAGVVAALRAEPPRVVVRWTDPRSAVREPNARGRPSGATALDDFLAAEYRRVARHGAYDVLERRP